MLLSDPTLTHEYLPITGLPEFVSGAARLILGQDSPAIADGRVVSVQTISGTGANHLAALFLSRYYQFNGDKVVYLSDPTWGTCLASPHLWVDFLEILRHTVNHFAIFENVGIKQRLYPYYDPKTIGLDYKGFIDTLQSAPERSVFLLHACAHNPTGVDPTEEQWKTIAGVFLAKKHYAFFDSAYQGFASGDLDRDATAVRHFISSGVPSLVCQVRSDKLSLALNDFQMGSSQSFAKNAGLYGERVGALHIIAPNKETANRIRSQLSVLQRSEISNPPSYGARVVSSVAVSSFYSVLT